MNRFWVVFWRERRKMKGYFLFFKILTLRFFRIYWKEGDKFEFWNLCFFYLEIVYIPYKVVWTFIEHQKLCLAVLILVWIVTRMECEQASAEPNTSKTGLIILIIVFFLIELLRSWDSNLWTKNVFKFGLLCTYEESILIKRAFSIDLESVRGVPCLFFSVVGGSKLYMSIVYGKKWNSPVDDKKKNYAFTPFVIVVCRTLWLMVWLNYGR